MRYTEQPDRQMLTLQVPKTLAFKAYFGNTKDPSPRLRRTVKRAVETVRENSEPRAVWRMLSVTHGYPFCFLGDLRYPVGSRLVSRVLSHCETAVVCAATLGEPLDAVLADEKLSAYDQSVLDRVASVAVEELLDEVERELVDRAAPDQALTARYSPGYCDWPLQAQRVLFALLPVEPLGITLSPSCLMQPRKSVTAVIGLGERRAVEEHGIACRFCGRRGCRYRRRPQQSSGVETG